MDCFRESRRVFTTTSGARPSEANRTPSAEITTTLSLFAAGGVVAISLNQLIKSADSFVFIILFVLRGAMVPSYGTTAVGGGGRVAGAQPRLAMAAAACAAVVVTVVAVVMLAGPLKGSQRAAADPAQTTQVLLGFDPYRSNSQPGRNSESTVGAFESDSEAQDPLPSWATEWSDENHNTCEVGAQCDHGNLANPLGSLGRWVMIKTSSHFNSPYDEYRRHKCQGLPGWALEECHRMRDKEHNLDESGNPTDGSEAKARPMMLQQQYRMHPAVRRALLSRWQHMRRQHLALARESAQ